ncbi:hypothetical protein B0T25DRAFT_210645 [Lasiosphaeria hispida]|uniref:Uncharacterized protein n=1 Tax=Lasiosphaeria hispida TaxID=260671 RepID=A0AAJ0MEQ3_9PEZI|nr:hypothetical protein B0T25DRAFT_210645 [Lasiosphaeria hispida]
MFNEANTRITYRVPRSKDAKTTTTKIQMPARDGCSSIGPLVAGRPLPGMTQELGRRSKRRPELTCASKNVLFLLCQSLSQTARRVRSLRRYSPSRGAELWSSALFGQLEPEISAATCIFSRLPRLSTSSCLSRWWPIHPPSGPDRRRPWLRPCPRATRETGRRLPLLPSPNRVRNGWANLLLQPTMVNSWVGENVAGWPPSDCQPLFVSSGPSTPPYTWRRHKHALGLATLPKWGHKGDEAW